MSQLFDVVAVSHATNKVRIFERDKTERNAEAIVSMAVMRRGCDEEFYSETRAGMYHEGDEWQGDGI